MIWSCSCCRDTENLGHWWRCRYVTGGVPLKSCKNGRFGCRPTSAGFTPSAWEEDNKLSKRCDPANICYLRRSCKNSHDSILDWIPHCHRGEEEEGYAWQSKMSRADKHLYSESSMNHGHEESKMPGASPCHGLSYLLRPLQESWWLENSNSTYLKAQESKRSNFFPKEN